MAGHFRFRPGRPWLESGRALRGGRWEIRIHRRGFEQFAQRRLAGFHVGRFRDHARCVGALQYFGEAGVCRRHVRRGAGGDGRRVVIAAGGRRVCLERRLSRWTFAERTPVPRFRDRGDRRFQSSRNARNGPRSEIAHHLAIFEGGHVWLPSTVAMQGVEWMEIQAMESGRKPRDQAEIDAIFAARVAAADISRDDAASLAAASGIAEDFTGLEDVSRFAARAAQLRNSRAVRDELKREADLDTQEEQWGQVVRGEETLLSDPAQRASALKQLRDRWKKLSEMANAADDTPERRMARRVLGGLSMGVTVQDPDYLAIVREYRPARPADGAAH